MCVRASYKCSYCPDMVVHSQKPLCICHISGPKNSLTLGGPPLPCPFGFALNLELKNE